MDYDEWNSCKRKVRYGHRQTAKNAVIAMRAKGQLNLEPYECDYCEGFHIGHRIGFKKLFIKLFPPQQIEPLWIAA